MTTKSVYSKKTYRITAEAIQALEELTLRLSQEARIDLARSKVLELVIFYAFDKPLEDIIK